VSPDIFVSYSHKDKAVVAALVRLLEAEWVVWWDSDLNFGDRFEPTILENIRNVPVALIVISRNSLQSEWVKAETKAALGAGHVIPILVEDVELPDELRQLHACNLTGWDGKSEIDALKQLHRDLLLVIRRPSNSSASTLGQHQSSAAPIANGTKKRRPNALVLLSAVVTIILLLILPYAINYMGEDRLSFVDPAGPNSELTASSPDLLPIYLASQNSEISLSPIPNGAQSPDVDVMLLEAQLYKGQFAEARRSLEADPHKSANGLIHLARMYNSGIGGSPDLEKAASFLRVANEMDSLAARFDLGMMLEVVPVV